MERGEVRAFVDARRQLPVGGARHRAHRARARALRADRRASRRSSTARTSIPAQRALILPCLGRSEVDVRRRPQFVTVEDSMSMVHRSQGVLPPASEQLRSEPAIVAALGEALLGADRACRGASSPPTTTGSATRSRRSCSASTTSTSACATPDGFQLPNTARDGSFANVGGRARFTVSPLPDLRAAARPAAHDDDPQPRPVQHDDLRPRRSLPRHPRRAPRRVHERRRHGRARPASSARSST